MLEPKQTLEQLATWGTENLEQVIAIDSQSDESSRTIPSTEGQRRLSDHLRKYFANLGFDTEQDDQANLLVRIPANAEGKPALALMVHMDTAHGTNAVPNLQKVPNWTGTNVRYPANDRLHVGAEAYPYLQHFVGQDLLHGPGDFPIGLDDKLGMAELMTLARILRENPEIPHGELVLVFRPDEEIGRMEAVIGLAANLEKKGVRYGYTVDGIVPFEINVANFNASRATVRIAGRPLRPPANTRRITLAVGGVNTHGATAKPEGYRNATVIFARAMKRLEGRPNLIPVDFRTDAQLECNARIDFLVSDVDEQALVEAFEAEIAPHRKRGATLDIERSDSTGERLTDATVRLAKHLTAFLETPGVEPRLSEESEGFQGYGNPHRVHPEGDALVLDYRLRDFDPDSLRRREEHLRQVCAATGLPVEIQHQYVNMGPRLAPFPELTRWAEEALAGLGKQAQKTPIRGGTGVDPFLDRNIPVANLGTGYFAPESEKELTSRQNIALHALWLSRLVQVVSTPT